MQSFPIKSISDLEKISFSVKWQYFEKLAAFILDQNGYEARQNVIVKTGAMKRQFDVIAKGPGRTLLIECKKWKSRGEKASALKSAAARHTERCGFYSQMHPDENVMPVIVILKDEAVTEHDGVPIIPIMKLNGFLNEM